MATTPHFSEVAQMLSVIASRRAWCAALLGVSLIGGAAYAQASPTVNTTAQITARVFAPLSVTKNEDLRFGNLFAPYAAKAIAYTDNSASGGRARLTIGGEGGAELSLVVNVPSVITRVGGSETLPVGSFALRRGTTDVDGSGTDAALATGDNSFTVTLSGTAGASGNLFLRVIGTATPGTSQTTGSYLGNISVTVNYTGA
jgi:spore coat protein U-like protein